MKRLLIGLIVALLVALLLCAWLDGGAQAQSSAFDRVCVCRVAYCWVRFVDSPGDWVLVLFGYEVRLPDAVELWNENTHWRCGRWPRRY